MNNDKNVKNIAFNIHPTSMWRLWRIPIEGDIKLDISACSSSAIMSLQNQKTFWKTPFKFTWVSTSAR